MVSYIFLLYFSTLLFLVLSQEESSTLKMNRDLYVPKVSDFAYWPNATVPFYINPQHFDKEQSLAIMSTLAVYAFKTCLQFNPVMAEPDLNQHVLSFENPGGIRKCVIGLEGHAKEEPHRIILGYDCLKTPQIDMLIMKALGFPFEHNRVSRDVFIEIQFENIEIASITLFTKEKILPRELRSLPYDVDSVLHFGERDFSKNGHRTILFRNPETVQNRVGLSKLDLRKIDLVYGPECLKRERQAKIDICRNYPVVRKKRDVDFATVGNLRVNSDISPPPNVPDKRNLTDEMVNNLKELGIENEVQELIDQIHKITAKALENAKIKHCNLTNERNVTRRKLDNNEKSPDLADIINTVEKYMGSFVQNALVNLTIFCDSSNSSEMFQRVRCGWNKRPCPVRYKSTYPDNTVYYTQHRPIIGQSTKHRGRDRKRPYINIGRSNQNADMPSNLTRRKRDVDAIKVEFVTKEMKVTPQVHQDILRTVTILISDKKANYAPMKRHFREAVSRNGDIEDGSDVPQEKSRKKRIKGRFQQQKEDVMKIKVETNNYDHKDDQSSNKHIKEYIDSKEFEDRKIHKRKRIRKERMGFQTPETVELSKQNKDFYRERIWPDGVVKYIIQENTKYDTNIVRERLAEVNDILKRKTCARLEEISEIRTQETERDLDYLVIDTSRDYVTGRVGGKQNFGSLELFEGGQHKQHAAMMVMAMLGFYFEVSRHDRDNYIRIHNRHIRPEKLHHFEKIRSEATFPLPYDYASATHPAWQFWRKLGKTGISTVATYKDQDPEGFIMKSLGQNSQLLSDSDIIKINSIYGVKCFQNQRRMKIIDSKTIQ